MIILSPACETITSDGVNEVCAASAETLRNWSQGKGLFWSREALEGEHVWKYITCTNCYMNPLIGSRHGCMHEECNVNLCETCLQNKKHEHPLAEYLVPKKQYSIEELFREVPHLLDPDNRENIATKTIWENNVNSVGFYFSAHWCPSCREFTPELAEFYQEAQANSHGCRLVFVSCDQDYESFNRHRSEIPWPAVPLQSRSLLKAYFQISS